MTKKTDNIKKIFSLKFYLFAAILFILVLIFYNSFSNEPWFIWVTGIVSSVFGALLVGVYYDFVQKEVISEEHLKIMEYLNEKNSSGIIKYYGKFNESIKDISTEVSEGYKVDIYLTYGYTILNNLSHEINYVLSKEKSEVNIYLMDISNPFATSYSKFWFNEDDTKKIHHKIKETLRLLKGKYQDLKKRNALNGKLNVYLNQKSPINYSFYLFDNKLFFVPSKNTQSKEFSPICILAQRTAVENALFNKVSRELKRLKEDECFKKVNLDE
tara:strand:- start:5440 stop:6252 length:813 start_codon:yes stop_codon:yes gene_type:complete